MLGLALGGAWRDADVHDAFGRPGRRAGCSCPTAPQSSRRPRRSPLDPARLDPLRRVEPRLRRARAGGARGAAGRTPPLPRRHGDDGRGRRLPRARARAARAGPGGLRRPRHPRPGAAASSARRRGPTRPAWPSSSAASRRAKSLCCSNTSRVPALPAASAPRSPRSGRRSSRARRSFSTRSASTSRGFDLVVTGEGRVDRTTPLGKAPGEVARRAAGTRCVVFGGVVEEPLPGVETVALSGDPARARDDLGALGRDLVLNAGHSASLGRRVLSCATRASASRSRCASAWTSFHAIRASVSTIGRNSQNVIA